MDNYKVSKNYAKALFMLASEMDQLSPVADDMHLVDSLFTDNRELYAIFNNPIIKQAKKNAIIGDLFDSRVSKLTSAFLHFVVAKKRVVNLRGICRAFLDMYRAHRGIVLADMVTSYAVNDDVIALVGDLVGSVTGKKTEVHAHVDESIIGGFVVKFDNNMFDTRIRTQINRLRKKYSENVYESKL